MIMDETDKKTNNTFALLCQLCAVLLLVLFIFVSPTAAIKYRVHRLVHDNSTILSQEIESIDLPLEMRLCGISDNSVLACEQIDHYQQEILNAGNNAISEPFTRKSSRRLDFLLFCLPLKFRDDVQIEQWIVAALSMSVLLITATFISLASLICLAASQRKGRVTSGNSTCKLFFASKMLKEAAVWLVLLACLVYPLLSRGLNGFYSTEYYVFLVGSIGIWVLAAIEEGVEGEVCGSAETRHSNMEDLEVKL